MKHLLSITAIVALSACAAPQKIQCNYDPDNPLIKQRECRDDGGFATEVDSKSDKEKAPDKSDRTDVTVTSVGTPPSVPPNDLPADDPPADPPEDDDPVVDVSGKTKGNASANNRKGGNYDKTGHSDNLKGKGRHNDKGRRVH